MAAPKCDLGFDILDAGIGSFRGWFIVKGKQDAGYALDDEQEGGDPSQAVKPAQGIFRDWLFEDLGEEARKPGNGHRPNLQPDW